MRTRAATIERTLETIALTETSWRVCDGGLPDDDATRLLAYVEECDGVVEVLWMRPRPGACERFDTLEAALECIGERLLERRIFGAAA